MTDPSAHDPCLFLSPFRSVVLFLVNNGAQVNLLDNQGCLPLHLAAWTGNADICRILVEPLNINEVNTQVSDNTDSAACLTCKPK